MQGQPLAGSGTSNLRNKLYAPEIENALQVDDLAKYRELSKHVAKYNTFSLTKSGARFLQQHGIACETDVGGDHSHPVSKTIENYLLRVELPPLLMGQNYTCLFMKESKFLRLQQDIPKSLRGKAELHNYHITDADLNRYKTVLPLPMAPIETPVAFIMDAFHHLTPADGLHIFRISPKLSLLFVSVIHPAELFATGEDGSNAQGSWETHGDNLRYWPDGKRNEGYSQPLDGGWSLDEGSLRDGDLHLSLSLRRQLGNTHLVQITRGNLPVQSFSSITTPNKMLIHVRGSFTNPIRKTLIGSAIAKEAAKWALTVKSVSDVQIRAKFYKLDQHKNTHWTQDKEILEVPALIQRLKGNHIDTGGELYEWTSWHHPLTRNAFVTPLRQLASSIEHQALTKYTDFLSCPDFTYETNVGVIDLTNCHAHSVLMTGTPTRRSGNSVYSVMKALILAPGNEDVNISIAQEKKIGELLAGTQDISFTQTMTKRTLKSLAKAVQILATWRRGHLLVRLLMNTDLFLKLLNHSPFLIRITMKLLGMGGARLLDMNVLRKLTSVGNERLTFSDCRKVVLEVIDYLACSVLIKLSTDAEVITALSRSIATPLRVLGYSLQRKFPALIPVFSFLRFAWTPPTLTTLHHNQLSVVAACAFIPSEPSPEAARERGERPPPLRQSKTISQPRKQKTLTPIEAIEMASGRMAIREINDLQPLSYGSYPGNMVLEQDGSSSLVRFNPPLQIDHAGDVETLLVKCSRVTTATLFSVTEDVKLQLEDEINDWFAFRIHPLGLLVLRLLPRDTFLTHTWICDHDFLAVEVPGDGNCLYHSLAHHTEYTHEELRQMTADSIEADAERQGEVWEQAVAAIRQPGNWETEFSVEALANVLGKTICVHRVDGGNLINPGFETIHVQLVAQHYSPLEIVVVPIESNNADVEMPAREVEENAGVSEIAQHQIREFEAVAKTKQPITRFEPTEEELLGMLDSDAGRELAIKLRDLYSEDVEMTDSSLIGGYLEKSAKRTCLINALSVALETPKTLVMRALLSHSEAMEYLRGPFPLDLNHARKAARAFNRQLVIKSSTGQAVVGSGAPLHLAYAENHWSLGQPPRPERAPKRYKSDPRFWSIELKLKCLFRNYSRRYSPNCHRAKVMLRLFKNENFGTSTIAKGSNGREKVENWDKMLDITEDRDMKPVEVSGILGEAGTGKSYSPTNLFIGESHYGGDLNHFTIVCPTNRLWTDLKDEIKHKGTHVLIQTWERALFGHVGKVVYFADCGLLPPMLDLFLFVHRHVEWVFFDGDTAQNFFKTEGYSSFPQGFPPTLSLLSFAASAYLTEQRRCAIEVSGLLGAPTHSEVHGTIKLVNRVPEGCAQVTSNALTARTLTDFGECRSIVEAQGWTNFKTRPYCWIIGDKDLYISDRDSWVALTRGRGDVLIFEATRLDTSRVASPILRRLLIWLRKPSKYNELQFTASVRAHVTNNTPLHLIDPLRRPGKTTHKLEDLVRRPEDLMAGEGLQEKAAYWRDKVMHEILRVGCRVYSQFMHMIGKRPTSKVNPDVLQSLIENVPSSALSIPDVPFVDTPLITALPDTFLPESLWPYELSNDFAFVGAAELLASSEAREMLMQILHPNARMEDREKEFNGEMTMQISEENLVMAAYPHLRPRQDEATTAWTKNDRFIKPRPPPKAYLAGGVALYQAFMGTFVQYLPRFDQSLLDECEEEHLAVFLNKGPAQIGKLADTFLDGTIENYDVFIKAEWVTKMASIYGKAKRGQYITGAKFDANFCQGLYARYLTRWVKMILPPNVIINCGLTAEELWDSIKQGMPAGGTWYNHDYTGWANQQNECYTTFWTLLFRTAEFPEAFIETFLFLHANSKAEGKIPGHMVATGFIFTWIINTIDSAASGALKWPLPNLHEHPEFGLLMGGDDLSLKAPNWFFNRSLSGDHPKVRPSFKHWARLITVAGTGYASDLGEFCSMIITPVGMFAEPINQLTRVLLHAETGKLTTSCISYAEHTSRLHQRYAEIEDYLTQEQRAAHALSFYILRRQLLRCGFGLQVQYLLKEVGYNLDLSIEGENAQMTTKLALRQRRALANELSKEHIILT